MTRTTSAKAYREETENGNITKKEKLVWEYLCINPPATGRVISAYVSGGWKRLASLERKGYVRVFGEAVDIKTRKKVIFWTATHPLCSPTSTIRDKKPTRKALEEKISHLEARCVELETIIAGYPTLMGLIYDKGYQEGVKDGTTGNIVGLEGI